MPIFELLQRLLNRLRDFTAFWRVTALKARNDFAVFVHQKLAEIPFDVAAETGIGFITGQELIERMDVVAFDRNLGEHRELDIVGQRAERFDFFVRARLL